MTGATDKSPFSAIDPTLGYLYQVRLALLLALRRLKHEPNFLVSIETLDDVTFETAGGDAAALLQTKHHQAGAANLTDASKDLWKTLRIWCEGRANGSIPAQTNLFLVTTSAASPTSAAARLRQEARDVAAAHAALDATAQTSTNQENAAGYAAYLALSLADRASLLNQVVVIDAAPTITDLDEQLRSEIHWAVGPGHQQAFLDRLEGWWFRRVLRQLTGPANGRIAAAELEAEMSDLRESFKQDALPIDDDLLAFTLDDATREAHDGKTFVLQMEIIKAGKRRIASAIRDYYRAFEQRSRWLREELVVDMDLSKYEKRLGEEWELKFDAMRDDLGNTPTEAAQLAAARSVLAWAETVQIAIRPQVTEPFVCRGSLHMLSDEVRIGWHPEFKDRVAKIIRDRGTTEDQA